MNLVEPISVIQQVCNNQNAATPLLHLYGEIPETQVGFPVEPVIRLVEDKKIRLMK
jgi:hypothetical protein